MRAKDRSDGILNSKEKVEAAMQYIPKAEKSLLLDAREEKLNSLLIDINSLIVQLHDEVLHNVFTDIDYYQVEGLIPLWVRDAGHSQESAMSCSTFEKLVGANNNYLVHKLLYYYDCEMLVNALQNRFNTVSALYTQVYEILTPVLKHKTTDYDDVVFEVNEDTERVNAYINGIIISLASSCDIMTKIAIELNGMNAVDYSTYPKMLSANSTYGDFKRLPDSLKEDGTYFAITRPTPVVKVETLRNEIVHNGSLDFYALLYRGEKDDKTENWILSPAFREDGVFYSFHGRKKFYDDSDRTWNRELPKMVYDFLLVSQSTLQLLLNTFSRKYYENPNDLINYKKEIKSLTQSFCIILEKGFRKKILPHKYLD